MAEATPKSAVAPGSCKGDKTTASPADETDKLLPSMGNTSLNTWRAARLDILFVPLHLLPLLYLARLLWLSPRWWWTVPTAGVLHTLLGVWIWRVLRKDARRKPGFVHPVEMGHMAPAASSALPNVAAQAGDEALSPAGAAAPVLRRHLSIGERLQSEAATVNPFVSDTWVIAPAERLRISAMARFTRVRGKLFSSAAGGRWVRNTDLFF